jgi:hypothetical protein
MKDMRWLRVTAIISNVAFIAYGPFAVCSLSWHCMSSFSPSTFCGSTMSVESRRLHATRLLLEAWGDTGTDRHGAWL